MKVVRVLLISICVSLLFLIFFVTLLIVAMFFVQHEEKPTEGKVVLNKYQYVQLDTKTNNTRSGFVSLMEEIDNYVSYSALGDRMKSMITKYGSSEFQCKGLCFCKDQREKYEADEEKHVTYLLSHLNELEALVEFEEFLREACGKYILQGECPGNEDHDVFSCEKIVPRIVDESKTRAVYHRMWCEGECITGDFVSEKRRNDAIAYGCDQYYIQGQIEGPVERDEEGNEIWDAGLGFGGQIFAGIFLIPFCEKLGRVDFGVNIDWLIGPPKCVADEENIRCIYLDQGINDEKNSK